MFPAPLRHKQYFFLDVIARLAAGITLLIFVFNSRAFSLTRPLFIIMCLMETSSTIAAYNEDI